MARPRQCRSLAVWMNGELVGHWRTPARASHEFGYAEPWLASAGVRPLSLSLPLRPSSEPYRRGVESFFENLLPDNRSVRERIQRRFRTRSTDAFDLLLEIGRDCVGALQLLPEDEEPTRIRQITGDRLTKAGVGRLLEHSLGNPLVPVENSENDFRISLAGAQEKTALLWHERSWHRPTGATPTTHILKLPIGTGPQGVDLSTSVENEWLCGRILRAYGIPVADARMENFGNYRVLVVERFDRRLSPDRTWWMRLPQEDFCQATATPPALKYENDGGPGIAKILEILRTSNQAEGDQRDFLRTQAVFWLLAAIDGHAKNFSIFLLPGGSYRLTPRYDVLSAHPMMGHGRARLAPQKVRMAMAVSGRNRHYRWDEIQSRHWLETARRCGFPKMIEILDEIRDRTPRVIEDVRRQLPKAFPHPISEAILEGVRACADRFDATAKE